MTLEKVYWAFAIIGGVLFFVRLALFLVGGALGGDGDGDVDVDFDADIDVDFDADVDVDAGDAGDAAEGAAESDVSFRLISLQSIMAFFLMFGLVGLTLLKEADVGATLSLVGGVGAGCGAVWVVGKLVFLMMRLQSSGTIDLKEAAGQEGSVYLTIPAGGTGRVRVTVQGRLKVLNAVSESDEDLKTGAHVYVSWVRDDNVLVVEKR